MAIENISFNVLTHDLVPEHHLLNDADAEKILSELKISKDQLPKIRKSDAGVRVLENVYGHPIVEGSVIKIVRKSETAQEFVAYRLVTRG